MSVFSPYRDTLFNHALSILTKLEIHVINISVTYWGKGMSALNVLHFTEVCTPIATIAFIYWFRLVVGTFEPHFHCLMVSYVVDLRKVLVLFS